MAKKKIDQTPKRGRVVGVFHLRVTLHERLAQSIEEWTQEPGATETPVPHVVDLVGIVDNALYDKLPYFGTDEIVIAGERTDS